MGQGYVSFAFTHQLHLHMRRTQNGVDFAYNISEYIFMGFLPDTWNCELRMRRECREPFPRHRGLAIPTCIGMYAGIAN